MPEAEEVLIDAARTATEAVGRLWRRRDAARGRQQGCWLEDHRARLELLLAAVHGARVPVRVAQAPAPPTVLRRLFERRPRQLVQRRAVPATDGARVFLPAMVRDDGRLPGWRWLRAMAVLQAGRVRRGSAAVGGRDDAPLVRDLYLLSEAAAVAFTVSKSLPGLREDLRLAREMALAERPPARLLTPREAAVEELYRAVLSASEEGAGALPLAERPADSRRWAHAMAAEIEARAGRYRGILKDSWSGALLPPARAPAEPMPSAAESPEAAPKASARLRRQPAEREASDDEDDAEPGMWMLQMDDPHEHVEDPMGLSRPVDQGAGERPDDAADSLAELPEARLVATPERAREVFLADDAPDGGATVTPSGPVAGVRYPEWDWRVSAYRRDGATVRVQPCELGSGAWVEAVMARRRALLDATRRRFEALRPRRMTLRRQADGDELDLDACVEGLVERRMGRTPDDRLYTAVRNRRRDVATLLLIDISGSTDAWLGGGLRIIDVEKEALLVSCEALEALRDPFAIHAFSGEGPHGVRVWPVKDFGERDGAVVRRRVAGLEPQDHTRAGAAIRHATAALSRRQERHRLLLLLSDGKPNDVDLYEGRYGVEDMRQAVIEARSAGVHVFCLTVDRQAPAYMSRIFGPGRHAVLRHARQLPVALVDVLRGLVTQ